MRDIKRIDPFLNELEQLWNTQPDLRFGQILFMLKRQLGKDDLFYVEDDEILEALKIRRMRELDD